MPVEILIACPLPPAVAAALQENFTVHNPTGREPVSRLPRETLETIRGLATNGSFGADAALIDLLPRLEIISSFGAGVDPIDLDAARRRGLVVTNTPDVVTADVADLAMALIANCGRNLLAADRFVRLGAWAQAPFPLTRSLTGKTVGIVGMGRIGQAIARRAAAADMRIQWYGPRPKPDISYERQPDLEALALAADFLVIATAGGAYTQNLIDHRVLDALGPQGILINVSRGSVVDEAALIAALSAGRLGGAGLDVFAAEPTVPQALRELDHVVLTPHVGTGTSETRAVMGTLTVGALSDHFAGRPVRNRVV